MVFCIIFIHYVIEGKDLEKQKGCEVLQKVYVNPSTT